MAIAIIDMGHVYRLLVNRYELVVTGSDTFQQNEDPADGTSTAKATMLSPVFLQHPIPRTDGQPESSPFNVFIVVEPVRETESGSGLYKVYQAASEALSGFVTSDIDDVGTGHAIRFERWQVTPQADEEDGRFVALLVQIDGVATRLSGNGVIP